MKYHSAASTMRNMFVSYRGGAYSRAGTKFVGFSKQTGRGFPPRMVTFQFSINQGLALEFGHQYMRVVSDGAFVTEAAQAITAATQSNPATLTIAGPPYAVGDWIFGQNAAGMTQLNGQTFVVSGASGATVTLADVYGRPIDSTAFGVYLGGGTAARVFTLVTPWAEEDLDYLKWVQSADIMSICCYNQVTGTSYEAQDLRRLADDNWTIAPPDFSATVNPPATVTGHASNSGTTDYQYTVTAINPADGTESIASSIADITLAANIAATAGTNTITWSPVSGVRNYNIYKAPPVSGSPVPVGSLFGYAGSATGAQFTDSNITADFTQVPPLHLNPFAAGQIATVPVLTGGADVTAVSAITITSATGSGFVGQPVVVDGVLVDVIVQDAGQDYVEGVDTIAITGTWTTAPTLTFTTGPSVGTFPSVVSYFQERRVYASSPNNPDTYWMSQPGAFTNFDARVPTVDSDAITGTPWSVEVNGIQFMLSMPGGLVVLTGLGAWQLTGVGGSSLNPQPITPANQQAQPQAYNGCSATVPPIKIDYDIIYLQAKGSIFRDLSYNFFTNIYTGQDLTQLSSHLFTGFTIRQAAYCEEPFKVIWAVRNDGVLLSLTYLKTEEVQGWARHDTNGLFVSVCAVTEPPVDALYVAVERFPPPGPTYMIERMDDRLWETAEDCWCVDAALSLPQPTPNATIEAVSETGLGAISGVTGLVGGQGYSAMTTASVVDDNGQGPGVGAVAVLTIVGGVITGVAFPDGGADYTFPAIVFNDPSGLGSGASAVAVLDNSTNFSTSSPVFNAGHVGSIIRVGGGIAKITSVINSELVTANLLAPILSAPSSSLLAPQPPGSWTLTAPVLTIGGLEYLAGQGVTGLADGNIITPRLVSPQGTITLDVPASAVTVGYAFTSQLQSVYLDAGSPTVQGQRKKIAEVTARLEASRGVTMGSNQPDGSVLSPQQVAPQWRNMDAVPDIVPGGVRKPYNSTFVPLYTGDRRIPVGGGFAKPGQVCLQQTNPLPMQVLAVIPDVLSGDTPANQVPPRAASGNRG